MQQKENTISIEDFFTNKPKSVYTIEQFLKLQENQSYEFQEECYKKIFGEKPLIYYKNRLRHCTDFLSPQQILSVAAMLPKEIEDILNPKQIFKSSTKNITATQFKDKLKDTPNCLILVRVQLTANSKWQIYGGYAPDQKLFISEGTHKTDQKDETNYPFIFDLNQFTKRTLISAKETAYFGYTSNYFEFGQGLAVTSQGNFNFAVENLHFKSKDEEENKKQKKHLQVRAHAVEIEVIQLY